jgi:hypothetical protein
MRHEPSNLPILPSSSTSLLSAPEFRRLAEVPAEIEWFANIDNLKTRRAYENALQDFMRFIGITRPNEFREITRSHVIAWRDDLKHRELSGTPIRASPGGTLIPVRVFVREKCSDAQSGQGGETATGGKLSG